MNKITIELTEDQAYHLLALEVGFYDKVEGASYEAEARAFARRAYG